MLYIDKNGMVDAERIVSKRFRTIERGNMDKVNGIVVHQTSSPTAASTFNSYQNSSANGAHFLIAREVTIYQTASLYKATWHVGQMKSRCLLTKKCLPAELKIAARLERNWKNYNAVSAREKAKTFPDRFPSNMDSIGIEIVGMAYKVDGEEDKVYEDVNDEQNAALSWLIAELTATLNVTRAEIYRHPQIARKNVTEARSAQW